jgi:hypothetical protein
MSHNKKSMIRNTSYPPPAIYRVFFGVELAGNLWVDEPTCISRYRLAEKRTINF